MSDSVTLQELEDLAIRAYDAGQLSLAGCLHMIIHASEQMKLDGLFAVMTSFNKDSLVVETEEGEEVF